MKKDHTPLRVWIPKAKDPKLVLQEVMKRHKLTRQQRTDVLSNRRDAPTVHLRMLVAADMRDNGFSFPQIGLVMNRDHASIIHLCRKAAMYTENKKPSKKRGC